MAQVKAHVRKTKSGQVRVKAHRRATGSRRVSSKPKRYKLTYLIEAKKWFDKVNGNTYHSVTILDANTREEIAYSGLTYGYGNQFQQTAYDLLVEKGLRKEKDRFDHERNMAEFYFTVDENARKRDL